MDVAYSKCQTCAKQGRSANAYSHDHPIVLERLKALPELLCKLPFDPAYQFNDIYLHRSHTRCVQPINPRPHDCCNTHT